MTAVRIIGIGSPHGADAAGWVAIEALRDSQLAAQFPTGTLSFHQCAIPVQLPQLLTGSRCAIVIDALPGVTVDVLRLEAAQLQNRADLASVHGVGVGEMLALVTALELPPPAVTVLGIGIAADASPAMLESRVTSLLPRLLDCIGPTITEFLAASEPVEEKCVGVPDN